jgi:hypothetical protein
MSTLEWAGLAVAVATIVGSFAGSVRWLVKHFLYELRPNGGGSVKDQVNALQIKVDLIYDIVTAKRK